MRSPETGLTDKQEKFCQYYAQLSDTYNNGTWSYAFAYDKDLENASKDDAVWDEEHKKKLKASSFDLMYNLCSTEASRLLRNPNIIKRVLDIKATHVEDDKIADTKLMDIIITGKHTDAIAAIKHRNELKQRVTRKLQVGVSPIDEILSKYGLEGGSDAGQTEETS